MTFLTWMILITVLVFVFGYGMLVLALYFMAQPPTWYEDLPPKNWENAEDE